MSESLLQGGIRDLVMPALDSALGLFDVTVKVVTDVQGSDPTEPGTQSAVTYTTKGQRRDSTSFFSRGAVERQGTMAVYLSRLPAHWSPSVLEPPVGSLLTIGGESGTVRAVHEADGAGVQWLADCEVSS